ncbi:NUMOD4 domain-containing protein [Flavobacterium sp. GNP002]
MKIWKDIPGYEGYYQASDLGMIKSLDRLVFHPRGFKMLIKGKKVAFTIDKKSYFRVGLTKDGKQKHFRVHQLVAMAFLNHIPDGKMNLVVDHINNIKQDNKLCNLCIIDNRKNISKDIKYKTSKYTGVYWNKSNKLWHTTICIEKIVYNLGYYKTEEEASLQYEKALDNWNKNKVIPAYRKKTKSSKYKGIYYRSRDNRWELYINKKYIKSFKTEELAINAYNSYENV